MSLLYVGCTKFPTNRFEKNLCLSYTHVSTQPKLTSTRVVIPDKDPKNFIDYFFFFKILKKLFFLPEKEKRKKKKEKRKKKKEERSHLSCICFGND
jgi:hypothetical protein